MVTVGAVSARVVRALAVRARSGATINIGVSRASAIVVRRARTVGARVARALSGGVRGAAAVGVAMARGSPAVRRAPAVAVSVSISEGNLAWEQRDHKTCKANDDFFHMDLSSLLCLRWLALCRRLGARRRLWVWMSERHGVCAGGLRRGKCARWNYRVKLPVGEYQVVAQLLGIVEVNRMEQSRQFVFGPDPNLHEHPAVDICYHVRCRCANHLGLADVVGEL